MDYINDDSTRDEELFLPEYGRGLDLSLRPAGMAYAGIAMPFPQELVIPRSDWQAMIEEMEQTKTRLSDFAQFYGVPVKNQQRTNFCWFNSQTWILELLRAMQNQGYTELSAASGASQITGYRNIGGYGRSALQWIIEHGIVPTSLWPNNQIDPSYATPAALQEALKYRDDQWFELEPNNLDQLISCLLRRIPVSAGLDWWGHQITYVDPVWKDGDIACRFGNSWGTTYGVNGYGVLQGGRILGADMTAPRTALAT